MKMFNLFLPLIGVLVGILIIIFRIAISNAIRVSYEKMPKFEDGVKSLNLRFELRPIFIAILGIVILCFSAVGFLLGIISEQ